MSKSCTSLGNAARPCDLPQESWAPTRRHNALEGTCSCPTQRFSDFGLVGKLSQPLQMTRFQVAVDLRILVRNVRRFAQVRFEIKEFELRSLGFFGRFVELAVMIRNLSDQ